MAGFRGGCVLWIGTGFGSCDPSAECPGRFGRVEKFTAGSVRHCYTSVVRGDSLRDLYAKTLALLGLGVLAGAGALVDYWPVGVRLPDASVTLTLPPVAMALPVPDRAPRSLASVPDQVVPASFVRRELVDDTLDARPDAATLPIATMADLGVGRPVGLRAPAVLHASIVSSVSTRPFDDVLAAVAEYDGGLVDDALFSEPVPYNGDDDTDGFLTAAFKKTGTSIVRTSVKTGASVFDAFRFVGGAVRRALPN
jgi:hypothetical protein